MVERDLELLHRAYETIRIESRQSCLSAAVCRSIQTLVRSSLEFLTSNSCAQVDLISRVPGKDYLGYVRTAVPNVTSRPANRALFVADVAAIEAAWEDWLAGRAFTMDAGRFWYTVALAPCMALELFDRQNKKGPATYFEALIGHIVARQLNNEPRRAATFDVDGRVTRLTMDFLFDATERCFGVHLPVKLSTRERVVQAWAHQRMLDRGYGEATFKGVMVCFSETKLDSRSREVVEICVPEQWLAYQALLACMSRIYYFDIPTRYQALTNQFPDLIQIRKVHNLPMEIEAIAARPT